MLVPDGAEADQSEFSQEGPQEAGRELFQERPRALASQSVEGLPPALQQVFRLQVLLQRTARQLLSVMEAVTPEVNPRAVQAGSPRVYPAAMQQVLLPG